MPGIKKIFKNFYDCADLISVRKSVRNNKKAQSRKFDLIKSEIEKYRNYYGFEPNLTKPTKLSEVIIWQKLFFYDERATTMTDKLACKSFFKNIIGDDLFFANVLAVFDNLNKLTIKNLPGECVLKCNHNSGYIFHFKKTDDGKYTIRNLRDKEHKKYHFWVMKKILKELLKINYYYYYFEWNYKNIKPIVFAEEYLGDLDLAEYKFYMNNGKMNFFHVVTNRQIDERNDFFNNSFRPMNIWADVPPSDILPELCSNIKKMVEIAQKISTGFPFLRVDLYYYHGKIYFGEATFFHMAGYLQFKDPKNCDELLGTSFEIPANNDSKYAN